MSSEIELFSIIMTIFLTFGIFIFALIALIIAAQWKIFTKAGVEGWKSLIPIYSTYVMCQIIGVNPWWIAIAFGANLVGSWIPVIGPLFSFAVSVYFGVILSVSLARAFGKEDSFAVGLYLVPIIFYPILGFSKDVNYVGNTNHMNDIIFDKKN